MNPESKYRSKSGLILVIISVICVVIAFVFLSSRQNLELLQPSQPLTKEDEVKISSAVAENLSDSFTADELRFTNFKGDHNWAIVVVYTTNEEVDPNFVLMKNTGSNWEVAYGPATDADDNELKNMGVPEALINQIDDIFVPSDIPQ